MLFEITAVCVSYYLVTTMLDWWTM